MIALVTCFPSVGLPYYFSPVTTEWAPVGEQGRGEIRLDATSFSQVRTIYLNDGVMTWEDCRVTNDTWLPGVTPSNKASIGKIIKLQHGGTKDGGPARLPVWATYQVTNVVDKPNWKVVSVRTLDGNNFFKKDDIVIFAVSATP